MRAETSRIRSRLETGLDAVERAQRDRDLAEIGVSGALAHPVDRAVDPGCARAHGRDRGGGGDAEVVVSVEVHGHVRSDCLDGPPHQLGDGLRRRDAECVDDDDLAGACLDGARVHALVEVRRGARRVDTEERRPDPVLRREAHRCRDPAEHLLAVHADCLELEIRDRRLDHRRLHAELDEELEVGRHRAREAPDLGLQARACDQLDSAPVVLGDTRESRLDPFDAEGVEQARDLELVLRREDDADGLLTVAQRRVVQTDAAADAVGVVERAGPDQVGHGTTPSGNVESLSTPSLVTRKLSSTRSPPPPGQ